MDLTALTRYRPSANHRYRISNGRRVHFAQTFGNATRIARNMGGANVVDLTTNQTVLRYSPLT